MEETLGKRISANRKRLGLTQDQLAERLGVTAQAVSKWENDQSCPDIGTLPRLADIFGITTDELLGARPREAGRPVLEAEVVEPGEETGRKEVELTVGSGRRFTMGLALWLLLAGVLLLLRPRLPFLEGNRTVFWTSGLLIFGLFGLYPRFSVFRLGCAILGGLGLFTSLTGPFLTGPMILLVLGGLLLIEALRGKKKKSITVPVGAHVNTQSCCTRNGEHFEATASFGEKHYRVSMPRLSSGNAELAFGEMHLDLTDCAEIAQGCHLNLKASFGELVLIVPSSCRVEPDVRTSFAAFEIKGQPDPDARSVISVSGSVSFGEIQIRYQ